MKLIKVCPECGLEFEATNGNQKFCKRQHFRTCVVCGSKFEVTSYHLTAKDAKTTCSRKCATELRKRTNIEKYGGVAPAASTEVQAKMKATMLERYGVEHAAQSKDIQSKMSATTRERYGVDWYTQTDEWVDKVRATSAEKYGTDWPTSSDTVRKHTVDTNISKYGVSNPMLSVYTRNSYIKSHMRDASKFEKFLQFKSDPITYINSLNLNYKPTIHELTYSLGVNESTVGCYIHLHHCEDLINFHVSIMEQDVKAFIESICDTTIRINVHDVINPNELDLYLPEYQLAIECNPTATHNSTLNVFTQQSSDIYPSYHLMKTQKCEDKNIFLFHIFGSEWKYKRSIIESMLRNLLGKCDQRIYARNCDVRIVDSLDCHAFLDNNHRQGNVNSPIRLGLYYNEELVSVMTFGKMRNTIGTDGTDLSDCWELVRFCSKLNTSVVGGASKLFKYFIETYQPNRVRSFSDRAHTKGTLYEKLGFHKVRESDPGYVWVDSKTDISYHRYSAQKHSIKKFLRDDTIDLSKTEKQIMEEHGFLQVFDCGTILWEWASQSL